MLSLLIKGVGERIFVEGTPDYYLSDTDFDAVAQNKNGLADELYSVWGTPKLVGRLGVKRNDVYVEFYAVPELLDNKGKGCISYYDKV